IERVALNEVSGGLAHGTRNLDLVAFQLQIELQASRNVRFVLDDEDVGGLCAAARRHLGAHVASPATATGSLTLIFVPRMRPAECAAIWPPRLRTSAATTYRPSPVPL